MVLCFDVLQTSVYSTKEIFLRSVPEIPQGPLQSFKKTEEMLVLVIVNNSCILDSMNIAMTINRVVAYYSNKNVRYVSIYFSLCFYLFYLVFNCASTLQSIDRLEWGGVWNEQLGTFPSLELSTHFYLFVVLSVHDSLSSHTKQSALSYKNSWKAHIVNAKVSLCGYVLLHKDNLIWLSTQFPVKYDTHNIHFWLDFCPTNDSEFERQIQKKSLSNGKEETFL